MPCTVVALVNSSKLGISKRKMVVGCSVSSTGGQGAETITESASFVGQGSFSRLGIIITFSLVWTSVKHELSAGGDAEAVLCQSYLLTGWNMRQTCFTVTSTILMSGTGAWARLCQSGKDCAWCYSVVWLPPCAEIIITSSAGTAGAGGSEKLVSFVSLGSFLGFDNTLSSLLAWTSENNHINFIFWIFFVVTSNNIYLMWWSGWLGVWGWIILQTCFISTSTFVVSSTGAQFATSLSRMLCGSVWLLTGWHGPRH